MTRDDDEAAPLTALRDSPASVRAVPQSEEAYGTRLRTVDEAQATDVARAEFAAGSIINNRFELLTLVGRGGMGMVFSALDRRKVEARDPNPNVAVKILNSSFQHHPDAFVALQREASKAQSLAHPNIVTVFDFDRDGGNVFITMELLRGRSLEDVIRGARNRGFERKTALPVIRGIAEGLSYAHRKGIVHSDLKPANIFLVENGTPKILDFGIARAVPSATAAGPKDQFDAGTLGAYTEGYATEEMVKGTDPAPADDIYALGIIAYELLAGKHPYGGKTAAAARLAGLVPAPIRSLRRREWQTLARALAFDRARRPRDATEFLRLFFGATQLRNALIAATLLLALASGYLWYQNYRASGPAVAFEDLPAAVQQQIRKDLAAGDEEWAFYKKGNGGGLEGSLRNFAEVYSLHRGDRAAVRGLKRAADEALKNARSDPSHLSEAARALVDYSDFLRTSPPVAEALGR